MMKRFNLLVYVYRGINIWKKNSPGRTIPITNPI